MSVAHTLDETIEHYAPVIAIPTPAVMAQAKQNLELRSALLSEFGAWTPAELADFHGSTGRHRGSLADNWRRRGRVIRVHWRGQALLPGFQFSADGHPYAAIGKVLDVLRPAGTGEWELALWWVTPTSYLDKRRPVDVLRELADDEDATRRLVAAAEASVDQDWF